MVKKVVSRTVPKYWMSKMGMMVNGRELAKGELVAASEATDERLFGPKATYWATPHDGDAIPCPEDGCNRLFASDSALRAHRVKEHGFVVIAEPVPTAEPAVSEPAKKAPRYGDAREEYYRRLQIRFQQELSKREAKVAEAEAKVAQLEHMAGDPRLTAVEVEHIKHAVWCAREELGYARSELRIFSKNGPTNGGQNVYERAVSQYHG